MDQRFRRYKGYVAFVDESYASPVEQRVRERHIPESQQTFYILSAYLVPIDAIDMVHEELEMLVPEGYWHTTDVASTSGGDVKITEFCKWDNEAPMTDRFLISFVDEIPDDDKTGEKTRENAIEKLLDALFLGHSSLPDGFPKVVVTVFESRTGEQKKRDNFTVSYWRKKYKQAGKNPNDIGIWFESPSRERCLWVPDLVAFVARPSTRRRKPELYGSIEKRMTTITFPRLVS